MDGPLITATTNVFHLKDELFYFILFLFQKGLFVLNNCL